jgi:hypothetical protein
LFDTRKAFEDLDGVLWGKHTERAPDPKAVEQWEAMTALDPREARAKSAAIKAREAEEHAAAVEAGALAAIKAGARMGLPESKHATYM